LTLPVRTLSLPKAIGWSIAFMLLGGAAASLLLSLWAWASYGDVATGLKAILAPGPRQTLVAGGAQLLGFLFATWVIGVRALGLGRAELRWAPARASARGFGAGLGLGAAAAVVALFAAVVVAGARWSEDAGSFGQYLVQVLKTTLVLAPAAFSEEVIFRGVPLVLLAMAVGRGAALVVFAGLVFALFHGANPGVTALGLGNIALAGIFLGVAFFAPGGIWTAFGAHLGWNATLAGLDAPVSGLPFTIPFLDYHAGEPAWLSGGRFGPEGGLLATIAITAALLVAARWTGKDPT
jgi:membrane protease YdiL (CAAX protease family)